MNTLPLRALCVDAGQYGLNISADEYVDAGIRLLRTSDLSGAREEVAPVFVPGPLPDRYRLQAGDLLLSRSGTIGVAHRVTGEHAGSTFAGFLVRFRPRADVDSRWLAYCTQASTFQAAVYADAVVSTISNFNAERYAGIPLTSMTAEEQRRIADFLDDQVARLEGGAAEASRLVTSCRERLEAERQKWVDRLADCDQRPLRALFAYFQDGDWVEAPFITDDGIRLLQTGNVGVGRLRLENERYVSAQTFRHLGCKWVQPGDVLICRLGSPVSRAARVPANFPPCITSVDVVIARGTASGIEPSFIVEYLSTAAHLQPTDYLARGATMQRLSRSQVGALRLPVPRLAHQREMVLALQEAAAQVDAVVESAQQIRRLLAERKRALITACVTGEFDVSTASARAGDAALLGMR